ncbi:NADH:ubiquinone reductase (Na(+)-transporting) subunit C [bacterium]|nr:NADH:ubiquinone reductase (Na(+)-transporting) subunit C [bacterium]
MKGLKTYFFIFLLCGFSALILSTVSTALDAKQKKARDFYQNNNLLKAANISSKGKKVEQLIKEYITPKLLDEQGNVFTFEEKGINYTNYLEKGARKGFYQDKLKLFYQIKNGGVVIPVNGFGLWDAIYGYIGIAKDGNHIIGMTWYDQKETPGLGAEIEDPQWQVQFKGKTLFHGESFGINFVPKAMMTLLSSAEKTYSVDAISGATLTTEGVQNALTTSLSPYIPLLKKMQNN